MPNQIPFHPSRSYIEARDKLDAKLIRKVSKAESNFSRDPSSPGLHMESITDCADPSFRSIRVDNRSGYRIICKKPSGSESPIFLYVDEHEKAYRWARTHKSSIGEDGTIRVADYVPLEAQSATQNQKKAVSPFSRLSDADFDHVEISEELRETLKTKVYN